MIFESGLGRTSEWRWEMELRRRKRRWSVVRFPCGIFPGMKSFSIYSLAGCYLFSSTDTYTNSCRWVQMTALNSSRDKRRWVSCKSERHFLLPGVEFKLKHFYKRCKNHKKGSQQKCTAWHSSELMLSWYLHVCVGVCSFQGLRLVTVSAHVHTLTHTLQ